MKYLLMEIEDEAWTDFAGYGTYYFSELTHEASCTWSPRISKAHIFNSREEIEELKDTYAVVRGGTTVAITDRELFEARLKGV